MSTMTQPVTQAAADVPTRRRVFSGIQPSGDLHLGNYLGAPQGVGSSGRRRRSTSSASSTCTPSPCPRTRNSLSAGRGDVAALYLAAGLDPDQCTLFVQSHVTEHAEGCWILNCITPVGWLERMTQYKDKTSQSQVVVTGLLDYPVLMAADIILYDAHEVPVGDDQRQHVELGAGYCPAVQPPVRGHLRRTRGGTSRKSAPG